MEWPTEEEAEKQALEIEDDSPEKEKASADSVEEAVEEDKETEGVETTEEITKEEESKYGI